jgi:hypothetical protein
MTSSPGSTQYCYDRRADEKLIGHAVGFNRFGSARVTVILPWPRPSCRYLIAAGTWLSEFALDLILDGLERAHHLAAGGGVPDG